MRITPFCVLLCVIVACKKNSGTDAPENLLPKSPVFNKSFGGSNHDQFKAGVLAPDGGYLLAGNTNSSDGDIEVNAGSSDAWVVKIDSAGNKVWQKTYGGEGNEMVYGAAVSADGGFVMAGTTESDSIIDNPPVVGGGWIFKIDQQGTMQWSKKASAQYYNAIVKSFKASKQGGFIACGYADYSRDAWIARFDENGNNTFEKKFETLTEVAGAVDDRANGDFVVASEIKDVPFGTSYLQITGVGAYGNIKWSKIIRRIVPTLDLDVMATSDGGSIAVAETLSTETDSLVAGVSRLLVIKQDAGGNIEWMKWFDGGDVAAYNHSLVELPNQHYIVAAAQLTTGSMSDVWLLELDKSGKKVKEHIVGGNEHDLLGSISWLESGQLFLAGSNYEYVSDVHSAQEGWALVLNW